MSEEDEEAIFVEDGGLKGRYVVCFDPLDGSSNIDCGVSIGTIFGIFKLVRLFRLSLVGDANADALQKEGSTGKTLDDVLRPGTELVAAGYAMYGSSTALVICTGGDVNGYTLDPVRRSALSEWEN